MYIDLIAIILSVVSAMVLGALWYSPLMFGKMWMKYMDISAAHLGKAKEKGTAHLYALNFVFAIARAIVIYILFIAGFELLSVFAIWIGFSLSVYADAVLWEGKPWKIFFINAGYGLVSSAFTFEILRIFLA